MLLALLLAAAGIVMLGGGIAISITSYQQTKHTRIMRHCAADLRTASEHIAQSAELHVKVSGLHSNEHAKAMVALDGHLRALANVLTFVHNELAESAGIADISFEGQAKIPVNMPLLAPLMSPSSEPYVDPAVSEPLLNLRNADTPHIRRWRRGEEMP